MLPSSKSALQSGEQGMLSSNRHGDVQSAQGLPHHSLCGMSFPPLLLQGGADINGLGGKRHLSYPAFPLRQNVIDHVYYDGGGGNIGGDALRR